MTNVTGKHAMDAICEALGIEPGGIRRVELMCDYNGVAIVRVDRLLQSDRLECLVAELREFRLEPGK